MGVCHEWLDRCNPESIWRRVVPNALDRNPNHKSARVYLRFKLVRSHRCPDSQSHQRNEPVQLPGLPTYLWVVAMTRWWTVGDLGPAGEIWGIGDNIHFSDPMVNILKNSNSRSIGRAILRSAQKINPTGFQAYHLTYGSLP